MTNTQLAQIVQAVAAIVGTDLGKAKPAKRKYPAVKAHVPYKAKGTADVDAKTERQMRRLAKIAKGFKRLGVDVTFDKTTGRFNNVKPYKLWLAEGRIVRKGQHGVSGMFHVSQTDALDVPSKAEMTAEVIQMQQPVA
jgi:hypothetical protein